jgi:hypothetical protein
MSRRPSPSWKSSERTPAIGWFGSSHANESSAGGRSRPRGRMRTLLSESNMKMTARLAWGSMISIGGTPPKVFAQYPTGRRREDGRRIGP